MRKIILGLSVLAALTFGGCRSTWGVVGSNNPLTTTGMGRWIDGHVLDVYTGNGHYDGKARWNNFTNNWQQIQNFADIYFWNYDIRDPYVGTPFFGDPH